MKTKPYYAFILGIMLTLTACENNLNTQETQSITENTQEDTTSSSTEDILAQRSETGMELMDNETIGKLRLGLSYSDVVAFLGEAEEVNEVYVSEVDGEKHQMYHYPSKGISLSFLFPEGKKNELTEIEMKTPSDLLTSRKIGIGSSYADTKTAYQNVLDEDFTSENQIVAGSIYGGVVFNFENDKVVRVFIGASAE